MRPVKGLIIDLDGCVYVGDRAIDRVPEALRRAAEAGIRLLFLTNNASESASYYAAKLERMGIKVAPQCILTSGEATAAYLAKESRGRRRVFLIGSRAFREELEAKGFEIVDYQHADFVVLGLDREFSYEKLAKACIAIRRGAKFVVSNLDETVPSENGPMPGAGALASAVTKATGVRPIVVGKPSRRIVDEAIRRIGVKRSEVAIVGDRIGTDIKAGKKAGILTILVLSGATKKEDLSKLRGRVRPDLVIDSLAEVDRYLARQFDA